MFTLIQGTISPAIISQLCRKEKISLGSGTCASTCSLAIQQLTTLLQQISITSGTSGQLVLLVRESNLSVEVIGSRLNDFYMFENALCEIAGITPSSQEQNALAESSAGNELISHIVNTTGSAATANTDGAGDLNPESVMTDTYGSTEDWGRSHQFGFLSLEVLANAVEAAGEQLEPQSEELQSLPHEQQDEQQNEIQKKSQSIQLQLSQLQAQEIDQQLKDFEKLKGKILVLPGKPLNERLQEAEKEGLVKAESKSKGTSKAQKQAQLKSVRERNKRRRDYERLMEYRFLCNECSYRSKRQSHMMVHVRQRHGGVHAGNMDVKQLLFSCDRCDFKSTTRNYLTRHIRTQHPDFKVTCSKCEVYSTNVLWQLKLHMRKCKGKKVQHKAATKVAFKKGRKGKRKAERKEEVNMYDDDDADTVDFEHEVKVEGSVELEEQEPYQEPDEEPEKSEAEEFLDEKSGLKKLKPKKKKKQRKGGAMTQQISDAEQEQSREMLYRQLQQLQQKLSVLRSQMKLKQEGQNDLELDNGRETERRDEQHEQEIKLSGDIEAVESTIRVFEKLHFATNNVGGKAGFVDLNPAASIRHKKGVKAKRQRKVKREAENGDEGSGEEEGEDFGEEGGEVKKERKKRAPEKKPRKPRRPSEPNPNRQFMHCPLTGVCNYKTSSKFFFHKHLQLHRKITIEDVLAGRRKYVRKSTSVTPGTKSSTSKPARCVISGSNRTRSENSVQENSASNMVNVTSMQESVSQMQDAGIRIQHSGMSLPETSINMQNAGIRLPDSGIRMTEALQGIRMPEVSRLQEIRYPDNVTRFPELINRIPESVSRLQELDPRTLATTSRMLPVGTTRLNLAPGLIQNPSMYDYGIIDYTMYGNVESGIPSSIFVSPVEMIVQQSEEFRTISGDLYQLDDQVQQQQQQQREAEKKPKATRARRSKKSEAPRAMKECDKETLVYDYERHLKKPEGEEGRLVGGEGEGTEGGEVQNPPEVWEELAGYTDLVLEHLCPVCEKYKARSKELMRKHIRLTHSDTRAHLCALCGSAFKTGAHLKRHERRMHPEKFSNIQSIMQMIK